MATIKPRKNYVYCTKTEDPREAGLTVKTYVPSYLVRPGTFFANVESVGPEACLVKPGDVILLPTTMEPVRASGVLVRETEIIGVVE